MRLTDGVVIFSVFDMGAQFCGYCADITVTFPVNGKFTPDQASVYNAVLAANLAVQNAAKPGYSYPYSLSFQVPIAVYENV